LIVKIGETEIINDSLQHPVKAQDSTWSLEKGKNLMISLTKATEIWWSKLVQNEGKNYINSPYNEGLTAQSILPRIVVYSLHVI